MKLYIRILAITTALTIRAGLAYPAVPAAEQVKCAAEDMQVLYYYLAPDLDPKIKERPTQCHGAQTTLKIPDWLEKALPAMRENKVWTDPEEGKLSEAQLWQTAFSILYELDYMTKKLLPPAEGGIGAEPAALETEYNDIRIRLIMSVDRITRAGLESSFEGRGTPLLETLTREIERMDALTLALARQDDDTFYVSAGGALQVTRDLFAQFFALPQGTPGAKFVPKYKPEARIMPGYRGVSLKVPASQVAFLDNGARIDMLVTFEAIMADGTKEKVTATILQNVIVVKVYKPETPGGTGVVQLMCNPNEAQYAALSLAQSKNINLIRRAPGD
ncbi:MAG: hypothetical protein NTY45_01620, partial [Elusimicrobia bacterium]|nr:hypothetical protein [Elusimicrobiota bacterium]